MKRYYKSALLATLALSLAGCGGGSSTSGSSTSSSNILKYGLSGIEGNVSPFISSNTYDSYVCSLLFEPLVTVDASGEYVPYLADWELSDDKLTYTFTLKDGIKFSDGTDMTAEDVAYSTLFGGFLYGTSYVL